VVFRHGHRRRRCAVYVIVVVLIIVGISLILTSGDAVSRAHVCLTADLPSSTLTVATH
jgi:ABC-type methionine transport system permease subunit